MNNLQYYQASLEADLRKTLDSLKALKKSQIPNPTGEQEILLYLDSLEAKIEQSTRLSNPWTKKSPWKSKIDITKEIKNIYKHKYANDKNTIRV